MNRIPFAPTVDDQTNKVACPLCGAHVLLLDKKDAESYSRVEFIEHWNGHTDDERALYVERQKKRRLFREAQELLASQAGPDAEIKLVSATTEDGLPSVTLENTEMPMIAKRRIVMLDDDTYRGDVLMCYDPKTDEDLTEDRWFPDDSNQTGNAIFRTVEGVLDWHIDAMWG